MLLNSRLMKPVSPLATATGAGAAWAGGDGGVDLDQPEEERDEDAENGRSDDRERREIGRMAVARDHLGRHRLDAQPEPLEHLGLDPGTIDDWFDVALIPDTLERTTLGGLTAGARVHLETDVLAKYVARRLERSSPSALDEMFGGGGSA